MPIFIPDDGGSQAKLSIHDNHDACKYTFASIPSQDVDSGPTDAVPAQPVLRKDRSCISSDASPAFFSNFLLLAGTATGKEHELYHG